MTVHRLILVPILALATLIFAHQRSALPDDSLPQLIERVAPAIVGIVTYENVERDDPKIDDLRDNPAFSRYFTDPDVKDPVPIQLRVGSGIVINSGGNLVTALDILEGSSGINVILSNGRSVPGTIIGNDERTGLALLAVESDQNLPFATLENNSEPQLGSSVFYLWRDQSVHVLSGIVSTKVDRIGNNPYPHYVMGGTLAPGARGTALFDMNGNVAGIDVAGAQSNSDADRTFISVAAVRTVTQQLLEFGDVQRGMLGVRIQNVAEEAATAAGLDTGVGVSVVGVLENTPGAEAGLLEGDIISAINGSPVQGMIAFVREVGSHRPGTELRFSILRGGETRDIPVTLGSLEAFQAGQQEKAVAAGNPDPRLPGLTLQALTNANRAEFGLAQNVDGVLILKVDLSSEAAEKGIAPGSVITAVDREPVTSLAELATALQRLANSDSSDVLLSISDFAANEARAVRLKRE